jgi:hypothetical protein
MIPDRIAWREITPAAKTTRSRPVIAAQLTVRLTMRSISYSR